MSLSNAGAVAAQSLGTIAGQINVVSRNISGVNVSGYAAKTALISTVFGGGTQIDAIERATNSALFQNSLQATSAQASSAVLSAGLDQIDRSLGLSASTATDTATGRTPAALLSALSSALQSYSASPSNTAAAQSVLTAAKELAQSLNDATTAVQQVREQADADISSSVAQINSLLAQFQQINTEIVSGSQAGRDVTDSLDKRDELLSKLSQEIGIRTVTRANNDMAIYTDSGATLFETTPRAVAYQATSAYAAGTVGNAVYVDGVRVTGASSPMPIQSGKLQGLIQLRDVTAPQFQSQLDETARGLISAFSETDQTGAGNPSVPGLFTYAGATTTPGVGLISGLAGQITVSANVDPTQGGDLDLLRDGGISNPGSPIYTYNTAGAAGYSARILQLVSAVTSTQNFDPSTGLDPQQSLVEYGTASVGWLAAQRQDATSAQSYNATLLSQTTQALSNATGVNLDDQMSKMLDLENSYQASAKLLATVDAMYKVLFQAL